VEALSYDLIVVGGGPAGSSSAITAARSGARVLLLERGQFPRHKVCGEFVSAESLELLAKLLNDAQGGLLSEGIAIPRARVFLDGSILHTEVDPSGTSIARFDLDDALWKSAIVAGVDAHQQTTVQSVSGRSPFVVATSAGDFQAPAVINATGRWSNLTRGTVVANEKWLGLKGHFAEDDPPASVDLYFFEGGYCGVQPVAMRGEASSGRINAAAMVRADVANSLTAVLACHPQLLKRSQSWKPLSEPVSTFPLIFHRPRTTDGYVLLAGDAATFVDPFIGDGISLAIRSGALAAESLLPFLRREISLSDAVAHYSHAYTQRLAPVFRASSTIRRLLKMPKPVRLPILFALENSPAMTRYLVRKTR
jgi:menaquinone-9 beta-reductase